MDHEEKFLMSECKHTPLCIVQETHDKLRVEELEKALRTAPDTAVISTCDGPAEYHTWYYGIRAEVLGERKDPPLVPATSAGGVDHLDFTGDGDPCGVPDIPGGYDSEVWTGGRRVIGHKSE